MKKILLLTFLTPLLTISQILTENFEGTLGVNNLPANWTESGNSSDGIFTVGNATEATSEFLLFSNHTQFAFSNDDACNCDKSEDRLILPSQDFTGYTIMQMKFSYFLNKDFSDTGDIEVSTNGGTTWTSVQSLSSTNNAWVDNQVVDLSDFVGNSNVLIAFHYSDNNTWGFGIGIDDVYLDNSILSVQNYSISDILLYPNPTKETLFLNNNVSFSQLKIINMIGQEVLSVQKEGFKGSIDVSDLKPGTYFMQIEGEDNKNTTKFIKY